MTVLVMGASTGNGTEISSNGKLRIWVLTYVFSAKKHTQTYFHNQNNQNEW
jgi:hypothetical protein